MDTTIAPTSYTPTTSATPTFGQSGASVSALQQAYNTKNASTPGFVPLKVDGFYGPKTADALAPKNNLITTSGTSRATTAANSGALDSALAQFNISTTPTQTSANGSGSDTTPVTVGTLDQNDPYVAKLNSMAASSDTATKLLVSNIIASKTQQANSVNSQYDNYKRGLQLLGIQHNEAQSTPDLLMGHINQAEDQHQQKLQALDIETNKALATAQQAQQDNDFKTLNAQMAYVKQLNAEKAATLKSYNTAITQQPKIAADVAHNVYATMQTLSPDDQESFLQAVAKQYNLPLGTLVTALTDEQGKQTIAEQKVTKAEQDELLSPAEAKTLGVKYGTTKEQASKLGIVPTTKKNTSTPTGSITKEQIAIGEQKLDASKGPDHYVDPYVYQQAYDDWTKKGGTTAKFLTTYPPKNYVNPKATNLPSYLMPTKAAASTRKS